MHETKSPLAAKPIQHYRFCKQKQFLRYPNFDRQRQGVRRRLCIDWSGKQDETGSQKIMAGHTIFQRASINRPRCNFGIPLPARSLSTNFQRLLWRLVVDAQTIRFLFTDLAKKEERSSLLVDEIGGRWIFSLLIVTFPSWDEPSSQYFSLLSIVSYV
jgi:hypothetical protein